MSLATGPQRTGTVVAFDELEGLGVVRGGDGRELPFHCVAIVDGTRRIDVGRTVRFIVRAGRPGQWEAAAVDGAADPAPVPAVKGS